MKAKYLIPTVAALTMSCAFAKHHGQHDAAKEETSETKKEAAPAELMDMAPAEGAVPIFDGETLTGWKTSDFDKEFFTVKDGDILGGSLEKDVPANVWLISEKSYENFELTFSIKFTDGGGPGLKNSGVQIRSLSVMKGESASVTGYQIDAGPKKDKRGNSNLLGYWGNIWDEHRRGALVNALNQEQLMESVKQFDGWNTYKVTANGKNIKTYINGILAHDYTEEHPRVAADGIIALQAHKGGKFLVHFKDLKIKELPATEGSVKWTDENVLKGKVRKKKGNKKEPKKAGENTPKPEAEKAAK